MSAREFCVYNETRENFLTARVTVVDTRTDPLRAVKVLIEGLAPNADTGLWLKPLKSVPTIPRLSAYDLVYLDHDGCVVHGVELAPDDQIPRVDTLASSALLLPLHTFATSKIQPGDRVVFRSTDDLHAVAALPASAQRSLVSFPVAATSPAVLHPEPGSGLTKLQALAWSVAPSPSTLPRAPKATRAPSPARNRFDFLRSLVHLRVRVQISITTAQPAAEPALHTAKIATSHPESPVHPRPATAPPGPSLARQLADLARNLIATVGTSMSRSSSSVRRNARVAQAAYLRWADTVVFGRSHAGTQSFYSIPKLGRHILDFILPR